MTLAPRFLSERIVRPIAWTVLAAGVGLSGCASMSPLPTAAEAPPQAVACPDGVPAGARCLRGQDSATAHYLIVMPEKWSGVLVVHAHGGPRWGHHGPAHRRPGR